MKRTALFGIAILTGAFGCASRPTSGDYPVWQTREGMTPAFHRDREYIRANCQLLKKEEFPQELRSTDELRERAPSLGANAIVVEKIEAGNQERTSFYSCVSLPSSAFQGPRGPSH